MLIFQVCVRCIFRIFSVDERLYSCASVSPALLRSLLGGGRDDSEGERRIVAGSEADGGGTNGVRLELCRICLGILQFAYYDQHDVLVKRECVSDFATTIADFVKQDGYQIDNFSIEVCLPSFVVENEESFW